MLFSFYSVSIEVEYEVYVEVKFQSVGIDRLFSLTVQGDGNIRYYEITDSPPYCHFLSQYISGEPQVSWLP